MKDFTGAQKKLVIKSLGSPKYKWRTIPGVAKEVKISEGAVKSIISQAKDLVVKSSLPSVDGQELYTTRSHYRTVASPMTKILGALRNRLD